MILKWIFDRTVAFVGLLFLWPVLLVTAILAECYLVIFKVSFYG